MNVQATAQLAGRSVVAGRFRIKRFREFFLNSNFRTFLYLSTKFMAEKFLDFSCGNFPENICYFPGNFQKNSARNFPTNNDAVIVIMLRSTTPQSQGDDAAALLNFLGSPNYLHTR